MGYEQGLSGLNASSTDLDVIGNNIANASTVGFKEGQAEFASLYANSLAQSSNTNVGIGTSVSTVANDFSQGTITPTSGPMDVAINGGGFFQLSNGGSLEYSRNGQFQLNDNGYIINAQGAELMGYPVNAAGVASAATPAPILIPTANIPPKSTTAITAQFNLDSRESPPTDTPFDPTNSNSYSNSTSETVYDSLGNSSNLSVYFVKDTASGSWDVYATNNNTAVPSQGSTTTAGPPPVTTPAPAGFLGTVQFDSTGNLTQFTNASGTVGSPPGQISMNVPMGEGGSTTPQAMTLDLTGSTQFGNAYNPNALVQDGYPSGTLTSFNIGKSGLIEGQYSNGKSQPLGQVALASFNNENGLESIGNNAYVETADSGSPIVGVPGGTNLGTLQSGAVESSNVNLTTQLVDLITAQRNYQANAQTIKTQQTVDQTLFNL
jgi:flagellar hook protein FlgE